jgi:conjugal transfer pilus assembly protein TraU
MAADARCHGKFANPVTDYCWSCIFPMTIGNKTVAMMDQDDNDSNPSGALCACTSPVRIGLKIGFWEPSRLVDVTRTPYCFVGLGGVTIDFGVDAPGHGTAARQTGSAPVSFYQVHWYTNPLLFWLEVLLDNACLEKSVFDIAYVTELDLLWADSVTSFIINPDVALFANPVAQAACAADCVAATAGFPLNELFWCDGCQGSMFPINGWIGAKIGGVQASSLLVARMTNKLHRQGLMWAAAGDDGTCGYYPQLFMDKTNYKYQMVYPTPQTKKIYGKCCQPFGRTTADWGSLKEFPVKGEDYSYQIYRKRNCCSGTLFSP